MATTVVADHKIAATSVARKAVNLLTAVALFVVASRGGTICQMRRRATALWNTRMVNAAIGPHHRG